MPLARNLLGPFLIPVLAYLVVSLGFFCTGLVFQETVQRFENVFLDRLFLSRYRDEPIAHSPILSSSLGSMPSENIILFTIDQETLEKLSTLSFFQNPRYKDWNLQRWPLDRRVMAQALDRLETLDPSLISVDLLFLQDENRVEDQALIQAIKKYPNIILAGMLEHTPSGKLIRLRKPLPSLELPLTRIGIINVATSTDGILRAVTPFHRGPDEEKLLSFALATWAAKPIHRDFEMDKARIQDNTLWIPNKNPNLPGKQIHLTSENQGAKTLMINWRGPAGSFPSFSFKDIFEPSKQEYLKSLVHGKIILIGLNHPGLQDIYPTPFYAMDRRETSGVEIHANIINTLLSTGYGSLKPLPWVKNFAIYYGLALLICLGTAYLRVWVSFPLLLLGLVAGWLLSNYAFQEFHLVASHTGPALSLCLCYVSMMVIRTYLREREKREIRQVFNQYVSNQVVEELLENPDNLSMGGKSLEISILFSDIRGFTSFTESSSPEEVVSLLNTYFELMVAVIGKHSGTINKFIGDSVMVLYGAPRIQNLSPADQAKRCLRTAIEMQEALKASSDPQLRQLTTGIGIATGDVIVGNIGARRHKDYTAIGDRVNLASRLESRSEAFEIIVDQTTQKYGAGNFEFEELEPFQVKGKQEWIKGFRVLY
jgi:adenylate cyclase